MKKVILLVSCVSLIFCLANAQKTYLGLGAEFGGFTRSGDWQELYGRSLLGGTRVEFGLAKGLRFTLRGDALFGASVFVDPISGLRLSSGLIAGDLQTQGGPAQIALRSRGFRGSLLVGYRHAIGTYGLGVRGSVGPSYLTHYIRIQDDPNRATSNLFGDLKRGYDRRAGGFGFTSELGIDIINKPGSFIAYVLLGYDIANTSALNSTQFDLQTQSPEDSTDGAIGIRAGFMLGLWRGGDARSSEDIYY